jgi:geranylgeranyl pyrophosphate synthase
VLKNPLNGGLILKKSFEGVKMQDMGDWEYIMNQVRTEVDKRLIAIFDSALDSEVKGASRYTALNGGHRWRALCAVATSHLFEPTSEIRDSIINGACSIEMVHAASLILDDLPSMDNAKLRRGKPCVHLVFPDWVVDMVPVFLITLAYKVFLESPGASMERRLRAALELSHAGMQMVKGQELDISQLYSGDQDKQILKCYALKTGALWATATKSIAIVCGTDETEAKTLFDCGLNMALYYQFMDDIYDVTSNADVMGKSSGMDCDKISSVSVYGIEGAEERAAEFRKRALALLDRYGEKANFMRFLIHAQPWLRSDPFINRIKIACADEIVHTLCS